MDWVEPRRMIQLCESWARTKHVPLMVVPPGRRLVKRRLAEYIDNLGRLYRAVQTTTGSRGYNRTPRTLNIWPAPVPRGVLCGGWRATLVRRRSGGASPKGI